MSEKKDKTEKKVILFSTRFLEAKEKLFCDANIANDYPQYCRSSEYLKFFLSANHPLEIVQYFNRLYYKDFFGKFKDKNGNSIINIEDTSKEIGEKLWDNIPEVNYTRSAWKGVFSDLDKKDYLFEIAVKEQKFGFGRREISEKSLFEDIIKHEETSLNNGVVLNTDFGESTDKRTIDRRFKIYKLKDCDVENVQAVYGVWCLRYACNDTDWYQALYKELEAQMENEFASISEILYFLHDGDIGENKPFEVKHYREEEFSFLDNVKTIGENEENKENKKTLSVAIFQHSLSDIATVLSTTNIDSAIKKALDEMEKGGKRAFLNDLSDAVACWHDGGRDIYMDKVEEKTKYGLESLVSKNDIENNNKSVNDVFREISRLINSL